MQNNKLFKYHNIPNIQILTYLSIPYIKFRTMILKFIYHISKSIFKSIRGVQIIIIQISYSKSIRNIQLLRPIYHILFWNTIFKSIDNVEIILKNYSKSLLIFLGQKLHPCVISIMFSLIAEVDLVRLRFEDVSNIFSSYLNTLITEWTWPVPSCSSHLVDLRLVGVSSGVGIWQIFSDFNKFLKRIF